MDNGDFDYDERPRFRPRRPRRRFDDDRHAVSSDDEDNSDFEGDFEGDEQPQVQPPQELLPWMLINPDEHPFLAAARNLGLDEPGSIAELRRAQQLADEDANRLGASADAGADALNREPDGVCGHPFNERHPPAWIPNGACENPCHPHWWGDGLPLFDRKTALEDLDALEESLQQTRATAEFAPHALLAWEELDKETVRRLLRWLEQGAQPAFAAPGGVAPVGTVEAARNWARAAALPARALVGAALLGPADAAGPRPRARGWARGRGGGRAGRAAGGRRDVGWQRKVPTPTVWDPEAGRLVGPRRTTERVAAEVVRAALARALQALWRGHLARERRARLAAPPLNENRGGGEAAAEDFDSEELRFLRGLRRNRNGGDAGRRPPLSHLELLEAKHTLAPFSAEEAYAAICALGAKPGAGGFAGAFRVFARARAGDLPGGEALPQLGGGGGGKAARVVAHGLAARVADLEAEAAAAWGPLAEWARRGLRAVQAERERRAAVFRAASAAEAAEEEGTA